MINVIMGLFNYGYYHIDITNVKMGLPPILITQKFNEVLPILITHSLKWVILNNVLF